MVVYIQVIRYNVAFSEIQTIYALLFFHRYNVAIFVLLCFDNKFVRIRTTRVVFSLPQLMSGEWC